MSVPSASGTMPVASATAAPPLLPPTRLFEIPGITSNPKHGVEGLRSCPELRSVRLSDRDRPAACRRSTDEGILIGTNDAKTGDPNVVRMPFVSTRSLCATGRAVERSDTVLARQRRVGLLRLRERRIGDQRHNGIELGIDGGCPREMSLHHLARGYLSGTNHPRQLDRREET